MLDGKIAVAGTEARTAVQPLPLRHVPQRIVHLIAAGLDHGRRHRLQNNSIAHADCRSARNQPICADAERRRHQVYFRAAPEVAREIRACDGEIADLHRILPDEGQREAGGDAFRLHSRLKLSGTAFEALRYCCVRLRTVIPHVAQRFSAVKGDHPRISDRLA